MNKMIKGSVAGATGIVLLMGGFGTYALWSDSADMQASKVTAGEMSISAGSVTWAEKSNPAWVKDDAIVPGDEVTRTQEFTIKGTGKNLKGTIDFAGGTISNGFDSNELDISVVVTGSDDTKVVPTGTNDFTFSSPFGTETLTAVVTYTFDEDSTGSQNKAATVPASTFTITQTR